MNFQNLVTTNQVVNELKDKKVRQLLQQHSIKTREPSEEALKFVVQFSKMTGDYNSLSRADLGIIALTLTYEWEMVGKSHLQREPKSVFFVVDGRRLPNLAKNQICRVTGRIFRMKIVLESVRKQSLKRKRSEVGPKRLPRIR